MILFQRQLWKIEREEDIFSMEILKLFICGNVDDGKSTIIGRLLYDSNAISSDIIEALLKRKDGEINLALITDGLKAEREQGITIDVAYKYFATSKRKFILVDTPGHVQYTRNMVTGASGCDLGIVIVDVRNGITEQTKRHTIISSILEIPHLVVCINKMDMVDFSEDRFNEVVQEFLSFSSKLDMHDLKFIPVSAFYGDNVVRRSERMPWYNGPTLMEYLENVEIDISEFDEPRFQVQYVIRPQIHELHDYRGYAGKIISGSYKVGDEVIVLPDGFRSKISRIESNLKDVEEVYAPYPAIIHLEDDIDIPRGTTIAKVGRETIVSDEFTAIICWMDDRKSLSTKERFLLQHNSKLTRAIIKEVISVMDVHTLEFVEPKDKIKVNDICKVVVKTSESICYDPIYKFRFTGGFILIDENTNNTIAGGVIL